MGRGFQPNVDSNRMVPVPFLQTLLHYSPISLGRYSSIRMMSIHRRRDLLDDMLPKYVILVGGKTY